MNFQKGDEVLYAGKVVPVIETFQYEEVAVIRMNGELIEVDFKSLEKKPLKTIQPIRPSRSYSPPGTISNSIITQRNRGVQHRFIDSIGGCSSNYR